MSDLTIRLPDASAALAPGTEIEVDLEWDLDHPADRLELRLVWNTSGKGDRDMKIVKTYQIASPAMKDQQRMSIVLPWGPYSFSGRLISLIWAFELVAFPEEDSVREQFVLAPFGREVTLLRTGTDDGLN